MILENQKNVLLHSIATWRAKTEVRDPSTLMRQSFEQTLHIVIASCEVSFKTFEGEVLQEVA